MLSDKPELFPYQVEGIRRIKQEHRILLADEPGLGKTRQTIEALDGMRVLVIAPKLILSSGTWDDEISKWSAHPDRWVQAPYTSLVQRGSIKKGRNGKNIAVKVKEEYLQQWNAIVLDEAHYIKNRNTSWTMAINKISSLNPDAALVAITGTPMPNWAYELYTVLRLLYPEEALPGKKFGSYQRWLNKWFERIYNPYSTAPGSEGIGSLLGCVGNQECKSRSPNDPCEHWLVFSEENLGTRFIRRLRDDVLDQLPPLTREQIYVPMSGTQKRMYNELKKEWFTISSTGAEVVSWTVGSRNVLIDKICTSDWLVDPVGSPSGGKLDRLRHDLETRSAPTLVLAHYRQTIEACAQVARELGASVGVVHGGIPNPGEVVKKFKLGELDVLVGSLDMVAEGTTLTVADMVIFVEVSYKPSRNEQAIRRVHRIGQTRPVTVLDYVTPKTVDERKRVMLLEKTDQQMRAMSAAQFSSIL